MDKTVASLSCFLLVEKCWRFFSWLVVNVGFSVDGCFTIVESSQYIDV